jgi:hypothetical protein
MAAARKRILVQATNQPSTLYKDLNTPTDVHFVIIEMALKFALFDPLTTCYQSEETPRE